jgi:cytochrome c7-like protein
MRRTLALALVLMGCSRPTTVAPAPIASRMLTQLKNVGVDPQALPQSISTLAPAALDQVMKTFSASLGIDCNGCHDAKDGAHAMRQLNIANKMWSEMAAKLQLADGAALYCDSCHQGRASFLGRGDTHALGLWMQTEFVDGLSRKDRKPNDCVTCHGSPYDPRFLDAWALGKSAASG